MRRQAILLRNEIHSFADLMSWFWQCVEVHSSPRTQTWFSAISDWSDVLQLALMRDGRLLGWGQNVLGQVRPFSEFLDFCWAMIWRNVPLLHSLLQRLVICKDQNYLLLWECQEEGVLILQNEVVGTLLMMTYVHFVCWPGTHMTRKLLLGRLEMGRTWLSVIIGMKSTDRTRKTSRTTCVNQFPTGSGKISVHTVRLWRFGMQHVWFDSFRRGPGEILEHWTGCRRCGILYRSIEIFLRRVTYCRTCNSVTHVTLLPHVWIFVHRSWRTAGQVALCLSISAHAAYHCRWWHSMK